LERRFPLTISVLLASSEARLQADAATSQREAQVRAEDIRALRDFQLQAMLAIMAEPTCKKAARPGGALAVGSA